MLNLQIFYGILADTKKDAEKEVKREISCVQNIVEEVCESEKMPSKLGKRNRKRKSYGKEMKVKKDWMQLMKKIKMVSIHFCLPVL